MKKRGEGRSGREKDISGGRKRREGGDRGRGREGEGKGDREREL